MHCSSIIFTVINRYCEDSLAEAIATLIWVAPRLSADIQELNQVSIVMLIVILYNTALQNAKPGFFAVGKQIWKTFSSASTF